MGLNLQGLVGALPRVTKDIADIAQALTGALGGGQAAQQPAVAQRPADQFQAPAATQQAAAQGTPAQFGQVINQIMQALQQIVGLLGGGQGQAQAPAVGTGAGGQAPAATGGAAPQAPAGGAAPAPAGGQNAVGGPQVQGGQGTLPGAQPQGGVNQNLLLHGVGTTLVGLGEICQAIAGGKGAGQPGSPNPGDAGGLSASADAKSITTSGGYKIQCDGANAWSITSPDGKPVKVDGDPHVHEEGVNFDFKKDSSFVLPDGTKVNCKTKDLGNGTSVSDQLEITKDGQHAMMDVSKGDGKVTSVDRGPEQFHTDQTFTMGADGKFGINGKTITGSQGADNFQTGGDQQLTQQAQATAQAAGAAAGGAGAAQGQGGLAGLANQIQQLLAALGGGGQAAQGAQPAAGGNEAGQQAPVQNQPAAQPPAQDAAAKPQDMVAQLLQAIMGMLNALMPLLGGAMKGQGGAPA